MKAEINRLTDSQWEVIKDFFDYERKRKYDLREIIESLLWITRTGAQWRNLDKSLPPWKSVYYYFDKWSKEGRLEKMNSALNRYERKLLKRNSTPSLALVDSQSVSLAPRIFEYRGVDGNKNVNGRKRQFLTDTLGRIWKAHVHPANDHDSPAGCHLLRGMELVLGSLKKIIGDKAYRGTFAAAVEKLGITFEVPQRPENQKGFVIEAKRWVVERSFAWMYFFRRVVVDHEHTTRSAVNFLYLANITMVLNHIN